VERYASAIIKVGKKKTILKANITPGFFWLL
jgi:hypothetical protein